MDMNRTGKREVVVVTGASGGIGRAIVRAFARQGARIGLLARGEAGLEGARQDVEALGGEALVLPTDVADPEAVERAAAAVEEHFGPIDVWVNDAFCSVFSPVKKMTPADYKRVTEVSYLGFVHGTLAALKRMLPRDKGIIVQVGSALAYRAIPLQSAYCAAKHAIRGFTDSLRCELLHDKSNVKITMVQMPALNTPQFTWSKSRMPHKAQPVPPIYQPEVAADAVVWAAHHYRREWFVGGSTATVIIGNKFFPDYGDHYLAKHGYEAQMYDGPDDPNRRNNLYEPVDDDRDFGAHGRFDHRAHAHSYQLWLDQRRDWLFLGAAAGAAWDVLRNGPTKFWRGGLLGLAAGALAALGQAFLSGADRQERVRQAPQSTGEATEHRGDGKVEAAPTPVGSASR
jgi:NAD(P)-dependent dehydrogenase (short-subunit alcohol dehydrogenase family)